MAAPSYGDSSQAIPSSSHPLPAYTDSPHLPAPDTKPTPYSLWIQDSDITGLYRRRQILPVSLPPLGQTPEPDTASPPLYTPTPPPLYTIKNHSQHTSLNFLATKLPDFTIYLGADDTCPVVATGSLHTSRSKRSLGELRFFPHTTSSTTPAITIKDSTAKCTFTLPTHTFEWSETGPGERPPSPPSPTTPTKPTGLLAKLKRKSTPPSAPPPITLSPRDTKTLELIATNAEGVKSHLATYTELQPIGNAMYTYRAAPSKYKDGHMARLEVHDPLFTFEGASGDAVREVVVGTVVLLVENARRRVGISNGRGWLGGHTGAGAGCSGGCGGGS